MNKIGLRLSFLLFASFCATLLHAQSHTPDLQAPSSNISSDFGPRNLNDSFDFHEGIDYNPVSGNSDLGYPVYSVDDGAVYDIHATPPFWIQINSNSGTWMYMHIFRNDNFQVGNWELRRDAVLEDTNTGSITQSNVIIYKSGQTVAKVFGNIANRWIKNSDGSYIEDGTGQRIRTSNLVARNEEISPMGDSGANNVHLHLGLNYPNDNPLYHVLHSPDTLPTVTIENPPANHAFSEQELNSAYPIKVMVNSSGGLDLDKVDLWIYKGKDSNQAIQIGAFSYGGQPGENSINTVASNGNNTGVQPIGDTPGQDRFVYLQNFSSLGLPEGEHFLVVKAKDGNGNETADVSSTFKVYAPPPPEVTNLSGAEGNGTAVLNWDNPIDTNYAGVMVVRKEQGSSSSPTNGQQYNIGSYINGAQVVYLGSGAKDAQGFNFWELNLSNDVPYFYTVYTYTQGFVYSKGMTVRVKPSSYPPTGELPQFGQHGRSGTTYGASGQDGADGVLPGLDGGITKYQENVI